MMPSCRSFFALLAAYLCVACANAQVIHVPSDIATIQHALDRATSGSTVVVAPGTYRERLIWPDRGGIRLVSAGDSSDTSIVGDGDGPVILMRPRVAEIDTSTTIQGFEITGGHGENGGGIALYDASPLLARLWIHDNRAANSGGGVYIRGSPHLRLVRIEANSASEDLSSLLSGGGGVYVAGGSPRMLHVDVVRNSAAAGGLLDAGGGIFTNVDSQLHFEEGLIQGNVAHEGGGLFLRGRSHLRRVRIVGNRASRKGGGISSGRGAHLDDVLIAENQSREIGGGAYFFGTTTVNQSTISHNRSGGDGGGAYVTNGAVLRGVTVSHNASDEGCDGLSVHGGFVRGETVLSRLNIAYNGLGVCNRSGKMLTIEHSWFGHVLGPELASSAGAGRGDAVLGPVDTPFWHSLPDSSAPPPPVKDAWATTVGANEVDVRWEPSPASALRAYQVCTNARSNWATCDHFMEVEGSVSRSTVPVRDPERTRIGVRVVDERGRHSWWTVVSAR